MTIENQGLRLEEKHSDEIIRKVFKPGNLVWGAIAFEDIFHKLLSIGIIPSDNKLSRNYFIRENFICFSLMGSRKFPNNYFYGIHHGPRISTSTEHHRIGIIINKDRLLQKYPNQLMAVGQDFNKETGTKFLDNFSEKDFNEINGSSTIFNIPIGIHPFVHNPLGPSPWPDEVRLYGSKYSEKEDFKEISVNPNLWEGLVLNEDSYNFVYQRLKNKNLKKIPIFIVQKQNTPYHTNTLILQSSSNSK